MEKNRREYISSHNNIIFRKKHNFVIKFEDKESNLLKIILFIAVFCPRTVYSLLDSPQKHAASDIKSRIQVIMTSALFSYLSNAAKRDFRKVLQLQ